MYSRLSAQQVQHGLSCTWAFRLWDHIPQWARVKDADKLDQRLGLTCHVTLKVTSYTWDHA